MGPIERAADAAWAHLEKMHEEGKSANDPAYVDRESGVIDGVVDMPALVRAVVAAIREPSEGMVDVGAQHVLDYVTSDADRRRDAVRILQAMIDKMLEEGQ